MNKELNYVKLFNEAYGEESWLFSIFEGKASEYVANGDEYHDNMSDWIDGYLTGVKSVTGLPLNITNVYFEYERGIDDIKESLLNKLIIKCFNDDRNDFGIPEEDILDLEKYLEN